MSRKTLRKTLLSNIPPSNFFFQPRSTNIFLISPEKHIMLCYSLQPHQQSTSNEYGKCPTVLSTSLGKTFFAWRFILN